MKRFCMALALVLPLMACVPMGDDAARRDTVASVGPEAGAGVNGLGIDLYHQLRGASDDNLVISPLSVALALGMILPGADGAAVDELLRALGADSADTARHRLGSLQRAMAERDGTDGITLAIANRGFAQQDFPLRPEYVDQLAQWYDLGIEAVDYGEPEAARRTINRWVATRTHDLIAELLPPGAIDSAARLTLVNAIYLLADWLHPFDEARTSGQPFFFADGSEEEVSTMTATLNVATASGDGYRAVELPYQGDELAMLIIVPDDLSAFETTLDSERLDAIVAGLQANRVRLWLPKAEVRFNGSLAAPLGSLGVQRIFCASCDPLPGMSADGGLVVSDVVHETYLLMDETGTEAAAATGAVISVTSMPLPPPELRVDRPYFLALRDRASGVLLFFGRVMDPR
ncbi:MAG: serpin family protein [Bacteroidales bacterium]|nr:serpin family protein [Bacteroidales bacterium]